MRHDFTKNAPSNEMGATGSFALTPANTAFADGAKIRAVTISGPGIIAWRDIYGVDQITRTLPVGTYPLEATAILSTGTTATEITGWY